MILADKMKTIETERLILRPWNETDAESLAVQSVDVLKAAYTEMKVFWRENRQWDHVNIKVFDRLSKV